MKDENDVSATQITSRFVTSVTSSRDVRNIYTRVATDVTRDVSDVTYLSLGVKVQSELYSAPTINVETYIIIFNLGLSTF